MRRDNPKCRKRRSHVVTNCEKNGHQNGHQRSGMGRVLRAARDERVRGALPEFELRSATGFVACASHATLDPDRAYSAARDGKLSLSIAARRPTQMMKELGT